MAGDAPAPGTADDTATRVPAPACVVCALALAVPAQVRPTAAEAATARNVRIRRLSMTCPLHCAGDMARRRRL